MCPAPPRTQKNTQKNTFLKRNHIWDFPDLPNLVAGNGSTYAVKTDLFLKYKSFLLPENNYAYEMQSWKSLDLDNYEDLILLESIILKKPELLENLEGWNIVKNVFNPIQDLILLLNQGYAHHVIS